jgi:hypothetical protein
VKSAPFKFDARKVARSRVYPPRDCPGEIGSYEIGASKVGRAQISIIQDRAPHIGVRECGILKTCASAARARQICAIRTRGSPRGGQT